MIARRVERDRWCSRLAKIRFGRDGWPFSIARFLPVFAILLVAAGLNLWHIQFPPGYHFDEPRKVRFILTGTQDFTHPILLLELVRLGTFASGLVDPNAVLVLGRVISAVCGTLTVLWSWMLARRLLSAEWALFGAVGIAVAPILAIHAHYLKEDVLQTCCTMLSFVFFDSYLRRRKLGDVLLLGCSLGLALASKYPAVLLAVLYLAFPIINRIDRIRTYYTELFLAMTVAASVFLSINAPLFDSPDVFLSGTRYQVHVTLQGHMIRVEPWPYLFGFHLIHSLLPGMAVLPVALALGWIVNRLIHWKVIGPTERLLVAWVLGYYLVVEAAPLKTHPDFARYVLPIVPALILLCCRALQALWFVSSARPLLRWAVGGLAAVSLAAPACDTVLLDYHLGSDTRADAAAWLQAHDGRSIREWHTATTHDVRSIADLELQEWQAQGVDWLVASSFLYDRYMHGSRLSGQEPDVYRMHRRYQELFRLPYHEFRPAYRPFAFSNPVIRVIDIRPRSRASSWE